MSDIAEMEQFISRLYSCKATHAKTLSVQETLEDKIVWSCPVEIFDLLNHPRAVRCYAWTSPGENPPELVTVLELPPVCSAHSAVRAVLSAAQHGWS